MSNRKTTLWQRFIFGAKFNWKRRTRFWSVVPLGILETTLDFLKAAGLLLLVPVLPFCYLGMYFFKMICTPFSAAYCQPDEVETLMDYYAEKEAKNSR